MLCPVSSPGHCKKGAASWSFALTPGLVEAGDCLVCDCQVGRWDGRTSVRVAKA